MKRIKDSIVRNPEYYLLAIMLLACYRPPFSINALGIATGIVFTLQIVFKLRFTGILLGSLFFLFNVYLIFALLSELSEFSEANGSAMQLALGGMLVIALNLIMSGLMVSKYLPIRSHQVPDAVS